MKREFSAGGVVINHQNQVLLIHNAAMRDPAKSYWGFPKGHLEPGESSQEAALREIKEETGLETEIIKKVGDSRYVFILNGEKIFKAVTIFLMKVVGGEFKVQAEELLGAEWFDLDQAAQKLSFSNDKKLLAQARKLLDE